MLRVGIIGLSPGNGHPYSWSAIFNGYDPEEMENCGFDSIPQYLEQQDWPGASIKGAKVTHVWTQSKVLSERIARASLIPNVVTDVNEMVLKIDALLLARDDAERHKEFAAPFLRAGIPVFVDKPPALSISSLRELYALETSSGKVFSCSALRFSRVLDISESELGAGGKLRGVNAIAPKGWAEYAVHIIEPVLRLLPKDDHIASCNVSSNHFSSESGARRLDVHWSSGVVTSFSTTGASDTPISFSVAYDHVQLYRVFNDPFHSFKGALEAFVRGVIENRVHQVDDRDTNYRVVQLIEKGLEK